MSATGAAHILLTGAPGSGKTTVVRRVAEKLAGLPNLNVAGFYTSDVRDAGGQRTGFQVVSLSDGSSGTLASTQADGGGGPRVGRYTVHVGDFERVALSGMRPTAATATGRQRANVLCVDEIGKMELFSQRFVTTVRQVFDDKEWTILATIPITKPGAKPIALVDEIRKRSDVKVITVTRSNRDRLPDEIFQQLRDIIGE